MTNEVFLVPGLPNKVVGVTWDTNLSDRNVFIVFDEHDIFTYIYVKYSIYGEFFYGVDVSVPSKIYSLSQFHTKF